MPDNKSISQLTTAEQISQNDLFETSIPNGSLGYLSRKASLEAIANFIANNLNYSDLQTVAKTLIGAINEAAQSGGGGASIEEMTQAEYNALTPEQKADGTLRAISDATTSISDIDDVNVSSPANGEVLAYDSTSSKWVNSEIEADAVAYDNTESGLTATDVNAAIDEVVDDVGNLHIRTGQFNSSHPLVLPIPSAAYGVYIIFGFFQHIGSVLLDVRIVNRAISKIYNLRENTEFSSSDYSFTYSSTKGLTITSTIESVSYYTALYS